MFANSMAQVRIRIANADPDSRQNNVDLCGSGAPILIFLL
jgi:hypothetical protein